MKFMMLVIPKGYEAAKPDAMPSLEKVTAMDRYNRSLQEAGVLLELNGLFPPSAGTRVAFADGKPTVTDGPFAEAKETIGGYWIIQVKSRAEAIEWAKRCPMTDETIELRQIHEMSDFTPEIQEAATLYPKT
jgi:hypothetical protein